MAIDFLGQNRRWRSATACALLAVLAPACQPGEISNAPGADPDPGEQDDGQPVVAGPGAPPRDGAAGVDGKSPENTDGGADGPVSPKDATAVGDDATPTTDTGTTAESLPPVVAFSPEVITFADSLTVTLKTDDVRAVIHYTLDDTPPTKASPVYTAALALTKSTIVRALAVADPQDGMMAGPATARSYLKLGADAAAFSSNLPIVLLHSFRSRPLLKADGIKAGTMTVFQPPAAGARATMKLAPSVNTRIGIKVHGSSSEGWEKKTYKIETWSAGSDEDVSLPLLGMPSESDWIFFGPYVYDRAMVRNPVMYALGNELGRWAPRTRFVEVFFTASGGAVAAADYVGVYVVVEKIKPDKSRLAIHKLGATDVAAPAVTGGYIFKIDRLNSGESGIKGGFGPSRTWAAPCPAGVRGGCSIGGVNSIGTLSYFYPDELEIKKVPSQVAFLDKTLNAFADALANKQDVSALIDTPAWIDFHILNTFTKNMDAHRLSAYFNLDRGGKLAAGPLWDFDRTIGCTSEYRCPETSWWDSTAFTDDSSSTFLYGWWRGLFADATFRAAYFARFRQLIKNQLSVAHLHGLVDRFATELGTEAPARNFARWPKDNPGPAGHAGELKRMKDWIGGRIAWIDGCLALPDPRTCQGTTPAKMAW